MKRLKKGIVIMLTVIIMLFQNISVLAATTDKVNFTDSNFEQAIRDKLGKATGDITEGDMETITALNLTGYDVTDLNGIQYAIHLKSLITQPSTISDISYLSNLTELMELDLHQNNISDISALAGLINIDNIILDSNNISHISALQNKSKLASLSLNNNQIQDITDLGSDTNLQTLQLSDNKINDITVIPNLTKLEYLGLAENSIHDISPLSGNITLKYLYLSDNNDIDDISPLSGLTNLLKLYISDNDISDITPLTNLINLQYLYLANNKISDLPPLSSMNQLKEINLNSNDITDIAPLLGIVNSNLAFVNLGSNKLNDILALTGISSNAKVIYDGYLTEKFVDENNNLIEPAKEVKETINDSYKGTNKVSGQFNCKEIMTFYAEDFDGYELNDSSSKIVTLDNSNLIDEVIFKYNTTTPSAVTLGSYKVRYVDENNISIELPTIKTDLSLGTYTETAKSFSNYILNDDSTKSVTLTDTTRKTIVFNYKKKTTTPTTTPGSVTIEYLDQDGNDIDTPDVLSNLELGTYTEYAKSFDSYSLTSDNPQTVTLTESNSDQTIVFNYKKKSKSHHHTEGDIDPVPEKTPVVTESKKEEEEPTIIYGSYIVRFVDESNNDLLTPEVNKYNFSLGTYIEPALYFDGYELDDQEMKSITLDKDHLNGVIEFKYNKSKVPVELPKTGDSKTNDTLIILLLSALSSLCCIFYVNKKNYKSKVR